MHISITNDRKKRLSAACAIGKRVGEWEKKLHYLFYTSVAGSQPLCVSQKSKLKSYLVQISGNKPPINWVKSLHAEVFKLFAFALL